MGNGYREGADRASENRPWTRLDPREDWNALVLRAEALDQLRSIPDELRARNRAAARDESGTQRPGLRVLLASGVEGSGRTLATQLVAGEVGGPVLQLNVAKALRGHRDDDRPMIDGLFRAAESLGAVVLLHQTESLLLAREWRGTRATDGMRGPDLLDLSERHGVLTMFASASTAQLDQAALARFDTVVQFPFPNDRARAIIWRSQLGRDATLEPDELDLIASTFQLPGGAIAGCCQRAAELAAKDGVAVGIAQVATALEEEYRRRLASDSTREALSRLRRGADSRRPERAAERPSPMEPTITRREAAPREPSADETERRKPFPREVHPPRQAPFEGQPVAGRHTTREPFPDETDRRQPYPREQHQARPRGDEARRQPAPREPAPEPRPAPRREPTPQPLPAREYADRAARRVPAAASRGARTRVRLALAVVGGFVIAAAAGGYALARSQHPRPAHQPATITEQASVGAASVSFPSTWQTRSTPPPSTLGLSQSIMLAPRTGSGGALAIGTAAGGGKSLLPVTLLVALPRGATPETVTLGGQRFYKYPGVKLSPGGQPASVYALPTTNGTIIAACTPQGAGGGLTGECERILATLRVGSGHVLAAGPSAAYASALDRTIAKLLSARTSAESRLQKASTSTAQAAAAHALAGAYAGAASAVGALSAGTASTENAGLSKALKATSGAYTALAGAAAHADSKGYRAAQTELAHASAGVNASLATLSKLGYLTS